MLTVTGVGCVGDTQPVAVDPTLTFAAHEVHAGLVIDRTPRGGTGLVTPESGWHWSEPTFVLHEGHGRDKIVRVVSPARVVVRTAGPSTDAGTVEPSWDNNAIRLTIRPAKGPPIQSDVFRRVNHGAGPSVLTRLDQDTIDLRGAYQASLRTPDGTPVGWIGLIVGEDQPGHVMYQGVLPETVDGGLAAGIAEALSSEVGWIEGHTRSVYRSPENSP